MIGGFLGRHDVSDPLAAHQVLDCRYGHAGRVKVASAPDEELGGYVPGGYVPVGFPIGMSPDPPQAVTVVPPPLRLMYQSPVAGRNTATSVLASPS